MSLRFLYDNWFKGLIEVMSKILIVDDDSTTSFILGKNLIRQGYSVETANSAIIGAELMTKDKFSLVITDIDMPEISGLDFLQWIKKHSPESQVIIMTGNNNPEVKNYANSEGALKYFEKPVNSTELNAFIKNNLKKGVSGVLHDINLSDFINIIILSGKQKLITVTDKKSHKTGKLFIKSGNIIHAEYENLSGKEAFTAIMKMKNGDFSEISWAEPAEITIDTPPATLLQEVARAIENDINSNDSEISDKADKSSSEKILIVDDDPITPFIIEKYFTNKGFFVATAGSAMEGSEILKTDNFSLVITDLNMPEVNGLEFLLWIKQSFPNTQVVIITAGGSSEIRNFANQKGAVGYFEKPVKLTELDKFIKKNVVSKGFSGEFKDIDLVDFIQILAFAGKNKLISVNDPVVNKTGMIYLKEGQIIHAESSDQKGEKAFYSLINFKSGMFSDLPWVEPDEITITSPLTSLLKKAAKLKEENEPEVSVGKRSKDSPGTNMIKARPKYLEKALEQREALQKFRKAKDLLQKLTIYECGVVLGIVIGRSNKDEVISLMKDFSKENIELQRDNQMFLFDDISFTVLFNDDDIVEAFTFGKFYQGAMGLGIKIDDKMEKAIQVYGKPKTCTVKGAVWDNIAFFSTDNKHISSIRMRNSNFFNSENEKLVNTSAKISAPKKPAPVKQSNENIAKGSENKFKKTDVAAAPGIRKSQPENLDLFTIYESGKVFNIALGKSTIDDVKETMEKYSKSSGVSKISLHVLSYDDLSLNFLIDDNERVKEINFGKNYPGATLKGIRVGDSMQKAIEIYGEPQYKNEQSANWRKFSVFCDEPDIISQIRLKKK